MEKTARKHTISFEIETMEPKKGIGLLPPQKTFLNYISTSEDSLSKAYLAIAILQELYGMIEGNNFDLNNFKLEDMWTDIILSIAKELPSEDYMFFLDCHNRGVLYDVGAEITDQFDFSLNEPIFFSSDQEIKFPEISENPPHIRYEDIYLVTEKDNKKIALFGFYLDMPTEEMLGWIDHAMKAARKKNMRFDFASVSMFGDDDQVFLEKSREITFIAHEKYPNVELNFGKSLDRFLIITFK